MIRGRKAKLRVQRMAWYGFGHASVLHHGIGTCVLVCFSLYFEFDGSDGKKIFLFIPIF